MKIRAQYADGVTTVKALIVHPMETGLRINRKTGEPVPAHYITEVTASYQGLTVMAADWGPGVSRNPFFAFKFRGGKAGETVEIIWIDNRGNRDRQQATIK